MTCPARLYVQSLTTVNLAGESSDQCGEGLFWHAVRFKMSARSGQLREDIFKADDLFLRVEIAVPARDMKERDHVGGVVRHDERVSFPWRIARPCEIFSIATRQRRPITERHSWPTSSSSTTAAMNTSRS